MSTGTYRQGTFYFVQATEARYLTWNMPRCSNPKVPKVIPEQYAYGTRHAFVTNLLHVGNAYIHGRGSSV